VFGSIDIPTVNNLRKYIYEAFKFRLTNTVGIIV